MIVLGLIIGINIMIMMNELLKFFRLLMRVLVKAAAAIMAYSRSIASDTLGVSVPSALGSLRV